MTITSVQTISGIAYSSIGTLQIFFRPFDQFGNSKNRLVDIVLVLKATIVSNLWKVSVITLYSYFIHQEW